MVVHLLALKSKAVMLLYSKLTMVFFYKG